MYVRKPPGKSETIKSFFFRMVWNLSEITGIGLGKCAPYVFGKMIGRKGIKTGDKKNRGIFK